MSNFFEFPGYEKHIVEKRIFELSPIEIKLVWLYQGSGGHIGFSGPGAVLDKRSVCRQFFFRSVYWSGQFKTLKRLQWGGCWPTPARCCTIMRSQISKTWFSFSQHEFDPFNYNSILILLLFSVVRVYLSYLDSIFEKNSNLVVLFEH